MKEKLFGKKRKIALIGFMGTGKTTVGKALARNLNWDFVDLDLEIERRGHMKIRTVFRKFGEKYFRRKESRELFRLKNKKNIVVSCGGGIILDEKNRRFLKRNFFVVLLSASSKEILKRVSKEKKKRPLLGNGNPLLVIKSIISSRRDFYNETKDLEVRTTKKKPKEIAKEIMINFRSFASACN